MPARRAAWALLAAANLALAAFSVARLAPRARSLADVTQVELGEGLRLRAHAPGVNPSFRMPAAPLLEADVFLRLGERGAGAAASAVYLLTAALVFALGLAAGGSVAGLAAAAAWQAVFLRQPLAPGFAKQFVLTPLVALAALALIRRARRRSAASSAAAGAAVGTALLARGTLGPLVPLLVLGDGVAAGKPRARLLRAAVLAAACAAVLLPWWTMNAVVHRRFVPLEDGSAALNVAAGALGVTRGLEGDYRALLGDPSATAEGAPAAAARLIRENPGRFLGGVGRRLRFALGLQPWLLALAVFGALRARREPAVRALAALAGYWLAIHLLMPVEADYFAPLWPLAAALAAAPLAAFARSPEPAAEKAGRRVLELATALAALLVLRCGWDSLGYAAAALRRPPDSDAAVAEAAERGAPWALLEEARRSLRDGDARGALVLVEQAGPAAADAPRVRLLRERALAALGQPESLLAETLPEPPERDPFNDDRSRLPLDQAAALERLGRHAEAAALAGRARAEAVAALGPKSSEDDPAAAEAAARLRAAGAARFAERAAETLRDDDPAQVELVAKALGGLDLWLAAARRRLNDADLPAARRALAAATKSARTEDDHRRVSLAWSELGDRTEARKALDEALRLAPKDPENWSDLGVLLYRSGDAAGAEKALRRALALSPADPAASASLGALLEASGRGAEAASLYRAALARPVADEGLRAALAEASARAGAGR